MWLLPSLAETLSIFLVLASPSARLVIGVSHVVMPPPTVPFCRVRRIICHHVSTPVSPLRRSPKPITVARVCHSAWPSLLRPLHMCSRVSKSSMFPRPLRGPPFIRGRHVSLSISDSMSAIGFRREPSMFQRCWVLSMTLKMFS